MHDEPAPLYVELYATIFQQPTLTAVLLASPLFAFGYLNNGILLPLLIGEPSVFPPVFDGIMAWSAGTFTLWLHFGKAY